jgi:hypothetical protein
MSHDADLPLDHSPKPAAPPRDPLLIVVAGLLSLLLWSAVVAQYVWIVLWVERLFVEFKMKLPWLTQHVVHEGKWAVPAITIATLLVCIALGKRSRWAWPFLLILLPLMINVFLGVSLYFPFLEIHGLSGGGKK